MVSGFPGTPIGNGIAAVTESQILHYVIGGGADLASGLDCTHNTADTLCDESMSPEEAFGIDSKMDDGKPDSGIVQVFDVWGTDGAFNTTGTAAGADNCFLGAGGEYNLPIDNAVCSIYIKAST